MTIKLTPAQLLDNARAMVALANGKPVQFWAETQQRWMDCDDVDCDFHHRPKADEDFEQQNTNQETLRK